VWPGRPRFDPGFRAAPRAPYYHPGSPGIYRPPGAYYPSPAAARNICPETATATAAADLHFSRNLDALKAGLPPPPPPGAGSEANYAFYPPDPSPSCPAGVRPPSAAAKAMEEMYQSGGFSRPPPWTEAQPPIQGMLHMSAASAPAQPSFSGT